MTHMAYFALGYLAGVLSALLAIGIGTAIRWGMGEEPRQ